MFSGGICLMFHDRVDSSVVCKYTNNVIVFQICKKIYGIKCVDTFAQAGGIILWECLFVLY